MGFYNVILEITWRQRTYRFVYPKSFTKGTSRALANWRAHVTNLKYKMTLKYNLYELQKYEKVDEIVKR